MTVLIFVLILSFLVIIHELGHFFAAKWAKIKVDEFGLGYPPKAITLFSWMGTVFTLNWIPFGGFVKMQGEDPSDRDNSKTGQFHQASKIQRLVVILAGAGVNFLFGVIAFSIVFSTLGIPYQVTDARIATVSEGSPAESAGIPSEVSIVGLEIEGTVIATNTVQDVIDVIAEHKGKEVVVRTTGKCIYDSCQESISEYTAYLRTDAETPVNQGSLGVVFEQVLYQKYPWWEMIPRSIYFGTTQALVLTSEIYKALGQMLSNVAQFGGFPKELAGPVGIVHQADQSGIFAEGFLTLLSFAGMLSVNLAIMNVLPIAPLDGGRAFFIILEGVISKDKLKKLEHISIHVGYIALLSLIVVITIKDVIALF